MGDLTSPSGKGGSRGKSQLRGQGHANRQLAKRHTACGAWRAGGSEGAMPRRAAPLAYWRPRGALGAANHSQNCLNFHYFTILRRVQPSGPSRTLHALFSRQGGGSGGSHTAARPRPEDNEARRRLIPTLVTYARQVSVAVAGMIHDPPPPPCSLAPLPSVAASSYLEG